MKKVFSILIACFFFLYSYGQSGIANKVLRLDLPNAKGGTVTEIFDEVNYIPLESTEVSLINKIDKVLITDKYYIVLDRIGNQILVFEKNGHYHSKIGQIPGIEKPQYRNQLFNNFTVDRKQGEIIVSTSFTMVSGRGKIFYFNFDGKLIRTVKSSSSENQFCSIGKDLLAFVNSPRSDINGTAKNYIPYNLLVYQQTNKLYSKLLPFDNDFKIPEAKGRYSAVTDLSQAGEKYSQAFFCPLYDYSAYCLDSTGVKLKYSFIFPMASSLPVDFLKNDAYTSDLFVKQNPSLIYGIGSVYGLGNWITFFTATNDDKKGNSFFYNTVTGNLLSAYRIQPDIFNQFLPLNFDSIESIVGCDNNYLYTSASSGDMFYAKSQNKNKHLNYTDALKSYLKGPAKMANPILIQLKLK